MSMSIIIISQDEGGKTINSGTNYNDKIDKLYYVPFLAAPFFAVPFLAVPFPFLHLCLLLGQK